MQQFNLFGQSYANTRTEDQVLAHAPIDVQLGGKAYGVKPLSIKKNAAWRKLLVDTINRTNQNLSPQLDSINDFMAGFMAAFFEFPEQVLELVLAYDTTLPREIILNEETGATDEEIVVAFSRIMTVAYPFFGLLGQMKALAAAASARTSQL